jgi:hypothetical protein
MVSEFFLVTLHVTQSITDGRFLKGKGKSPKRDRKFTRRSPKWIVNLLYYIGIEKINVKHIAR